MKPVSFKPHHYLIVLKLLYY